MNKWIRNRFCFVFGHVVRYSNFMAKAYGDGQCLVCGSRYPQMHWQDYVCDVVAKDDSDIERLRHWYYILLPGCFYEWMYRKIQRVDYLWCAKRGHDLVDEGYAGPESGCIDMTCRKCGFSYGRKYLY